MFGYLIARLTHFETLELLAFHQMTSNFETLHLLRPVISSCRVKTHKIYKIIL